MGNIFEYEFIKNAFILLLIVSPLFGLLSTMVVNNKLAYFSDALGHSAYMGIGIGLLLGMSTDSIFPILIFSVIFSILLVLIKRKSKQSPDTVIGIISSISIALGIIILSNYGGMQKFSKLLVGDLLLVGKDQIFSLAIFAVIIYIVFFCIYKKLILINIDKSLARSKGVNPTLYEILFTSIIAITVSISINIIGILLINSLFILPGAISSKISKNMKSYMIISVIISLISSIVGLVVSYYFSVPTGACIVCVMGILYIIERIFVK